jgi:flagellar hook-basal body complex protein FliE
MTIASMSRALSAYGAALQRTQPGTTMPNVGSGPPSEFASLLRSELKTTDATLHASEAKAVEALTGKASLQDVVEAVTEAELSLQKMTAVRDRVISAYQEIMRMPI